MKKQCTIEKSDLIATLDRNIEFVDRCDMKVSIVLAILGVILTIIFTNDGISSLWHILKTAFSFKNTSFDVVYLFFLVLFAAGYSYGMLKLIMVLFVKIDCKEYEQDLLELDSSIFFYSIANRKNYKEYKGIILGKEYCYENDLISQIYLNSLICAKKYKNYKKGLMYSLLFFLLFTIVWGCGIIFY